MVMRIAIVFALLSAAIGILADAPDIHKMVVGSKVMEVIQTRQLTFREDGEVQSISLSPNGKYAVYLTVQPNTDSAGRIGRLYLTNSSGGKPVLLMEGSMPMQDYPDNQEWKLPYSVDWSPDSKLIAFVAGWRDNAQAIADNAVARADRRQALVIFGTSGTMVTAYYSPKGSDLLPSDWSPDSRRFAVLCNSNKRDPENGDHDIAVISYDVLGKRAETLFKKTSRSIMVECWIEDGKGLLCTEFHQGNRYQRKLYIDGRPPVEYAQKPESLSYEKMHGIPFDIRGAEGGVAISDVATGKTIRTLKGFQEDQVSAVPNTRLIMYGTQQTIQDGPDGQKHKAHSIWLMYPEGEKQNRMCVALGMELGTLSESHNCLRIGYVSKGRALIAELELRKATPREKVAAGIRLTEEETKSLMLENARQVADALGDSVFQSEEYPSQEDFIERMKYHIRDSSALLRPGTDKIAVTYFRPDEKYNIANMPPANTVIGVMDGGYGWQIKIFADGRVEETPK